MPEIIYVVTMGIIRDDHFGVNTVVATELGEINQAPTLQKYMTTLGLTPVEWMRDNCRLIASHTNTTVKHVLIDPKTRLEDDIRVYKPERLWTGEPNKPTYEHAEDPDKADENTTGLIFGIDGVVFLLFGMIALLILAALIGSVIN